MLRSTDPLGRRERSRQASDRRFHYRRSQASLATATSAATTRITAAAATRITAAAASAETAKATAGSRTAAPAPTESATSITPAAVTRGGPHGSKRFDSSLNFRRLIGRIVGVVVAA